MKTSIHKNLNKVLKKNEFYFLQIYRSYYCISSFFTYKLTEKTSLALIIKKSQSFTRV